MQNCIILVDKPSGITSYDVIRKLQKITGIKKIGHAGVLDKSASGLLVCATGRATKILSLFEDGYKIYTADIVLGIKTDTYDLEGKVVAKNDNISVSINEIKNVLTKFQGEIEQTTPMYSNVKVDGKKLYQYALKNQDIEPPKRKVFIYGIEIVGFEDNILSVMVKCSKGTYIRALANDIGEKLGVFGCVKSLKRIFSYPFSIDSANNLDNIECLSINEALNFLPSVRIDDDIKTKVRNGVVFNKIFDIGNLKSGIYRILDKNDKLLAVIEKEKSKTKYKFININ